VQILTTRIQISPFKIYALSSGISFAPTLWPKEANQIAGVAVHLVRWINLCAGLLINRLAVL